MEFKQPKPKLKADELYLAHDRIVCGRLHCAGMSAHFTGKTIHGLRVRKISAEEIREKQLNCEMCNARP